VAALQLAMITACTITESEQTLISHGGQSLASLHGPTAGPTTMLLHGQRSPDT
jgi:hypothetical protein